MISNITSIELIRVTDDCVPKIDCRPRFEINVNGASLVAVWDSCADISVWNGTVDSLLQVFPSAYRFTNDCSVSGFGGDDETHHYVYIIPEINIGEFILINLPVAIIITKASYQLLLHCGIFSDRGIALNFTSKMLHIPLQGGPHVLEPIVDKGEYVGTRVEAQQELSGIVDLLQMDNECVERSYPPDFISYAVRKGWSTNRLAQDVISKMPDSLLDHYKTLLENVLVGWESYKKVFK